MSGMSGNVNLTSDTTVSGVSRDVRGVRGGEDLSVSGAGGNP